MPAYHAALGKGAISSGHVYAFARATARLDDAARAAFEDRTDEFTEAAASVSVDEFSKQCRQVARDAPGVEGLAELERQRALRAVSRHVGQETGMAITRLVFDPRPTSESGPPSPR